VYADQRSTAKSSTGQVPPSLVQSINPIFIIVFRSVFAAL